MAGPGLSFPPFAKPADADRGRKAVGVNVACRRYPQQVAAGSLEASNVDVIKELVGLISAQRAFEGNAKVIETADQILQCVNTLRRK